MKNSIHTTITFSLLASYFLFLAACSDNSDPSNGNKGDTPIAPVVTENTSNKEPNTDNTISAPAPVAPPPSPTSSAEATDTTPAPISQPVTPTPSPSVPPLPSAEALAAYKMTLSEKTLTLAKKGGCLVCHNVQTKIVGPAWKLVSLRMKGIAGSQERIIKKVKTGGKGLYGNVPMPPYSPRVSDADITAIVSAILMDGGDGK